MERSFTIFGFLIAAVFVLAFALDLALGWPFLRVRPLYDLCNIAGGLGLAYLSWNAWRDLA